MSMRSRMRARQGLAGAVALAVALGVSGCQQDKADEGGLPELPSGSASASSSAPAPSASASSPVPIATPTPTAAAFPTFEPVTSETAGTAAEAEKRGFAAVDLLYKVTGAVLNSGDEANVNRLGVAAEGGMLDEQTQLVTAILDKKGTYRGESTAELIEATAAPAAKPDRSLIENATVHLTVCEDNSKVKITDAEGKPVKTGTPRFRVKYMTMWNPETHTWSVVSSELPPLDGPEETTC